MQLKVIYFQYFILLFLALDISCISARLPVEDNSAGEWQRPVDLNLQKKVMAKTASKNTDEMAQKKMGSLYGIKVKVQCGEWDEKPTDFKLKKDDFCNDFKETLEAYGAEIETNGLDSLATNTGVSTRQFGQTDHDSPTDSKTKKTLTIRVLWGPKESIGCGMAGWLTYLSIGLIPCKTYTNREGILSILDSEGNALEQYAMNSRIVWRFGWLALLTIPHGKKREVLYDQSLIKFALGHTYTTAVKMKWLEASL